jgi:pilus assembly protein CpaF
LEGEQGSLNGRREVIRGELRRNVMGQLKDQIYLEDEQLYEQIDTAIRQKGKETYLPLKERLWLRNSLYDSFRRLDILQELLDDKDVTEIMINGAGKIFIEKKGNMVLWNRRFEKTEQLEDIIQQIVGKVNRIVNVSSPIADARLEDGSRVHIVLPPVALDGPVVTIRKFPDPITIEKLIRFQALTEEAAQFLEQLVKAKYNLFVCGGTNSGKTTFLNALSSFIPETERVITIEDSAELQITHVPNLVRLETRNANTEGEGEITISQLIKASLRMNPSRIIVGEVRGALELFAACDVVYMPVLDDPVSTAKLEDFETYLKEAGHKGMEEKIQKLHLPEIKTGIRRGGYMEQLLWSEMGDYVRKLLEGGY